MQARVKQTKKTHLIHYVSNEEIYSALKTGCILYIYFAHYGFHLLSLLFSVQVILFTQTIRKNLYTHPVS